MTAPVCICVEEEEPEIFLAPRNFNPHPYQSGYNAETGGNGNTGPVVFPATRGADGKAASATGRTALDADSHPYASVVKRKRYKQAGRFAAQVKLIIIIIITFIYLFIQHTLQFENEPV